jgi:hypothetical protein
LGGFAFEDLASDGVQSIPTCKKKRGATKKRGGLTG